MRADYQGTASRTQARSGNLIRRMAYRITVGVFAANPTPHYLPRGYVDRDDEEFPQVVGRRLQRAHPVPRMRRAPKSRLPFPRGSSEAATRSSSKLGAEWVGSRPSSSMIRILPPQVASQSASVLK